MNEGAGVDLFSGDADNQIALLNQYIAFVCRETGQEPCIVGSQMFVQAGMNDIDQRCDGYLTWLDARRRDQTPVLAEISAIQGATHDIMAITGSSVTSLNVVTTAFALASATYANWNSRLLISVNQSTIQEVVYNSQWKYRDKIKTALVPDQPTAIYLLRNYLRLCMPITIEASINTSTLLVQRDLGPNITQPLVVQSTVPPPRPTPPPAMRTSHTFVEDDDAAAALRKFLRPSAGAVDQDHLAQIRAFINDPAQNFQPIPQVTTFMSGAEFAAKRQELARKLGLIR